MSEKRQVLAAMVGRVGGSGPGSTRRTQPRPQMPIAPDRGPGSGRDPHTPPTG
ncbi:hypothetical protein TOK_1384 [Pseudonocardia sp. N23]|nr:hypothetical protein TOK_1384 [Pseudonocardia sp. N23]